MQLCAVIGRYRYGAAADHVRVTLISPGGRSDMHSLVVRTIPGRSGMVSLDLGSISLEAREGRLSAVHERDPASYALVEAANPNASPVTVIRETLPPLPVPQISLAFDEGEVEWCPLTPDITWVSAERLSDGIAPSMKLTGHSSIGPVTLEIAAGRFRRFEGDLDPSGETRIVIEATPVDEGDPAGWALRLDGRRQLARMDLLRPLGPAVEVEDQWPSVTLMRAGGAIANAFDGDWRDSAQLRPVVVFGSEAGTPDRVRLIEQAMLEFGRGITRGRILGTYDSRERVRPVLGIVLLSQDGHTRAAFAELAAAWDERFGGLSPVARPQLFWSPAESRLLDRLKLHASMVVTLVGRDGEVLAVVPVDESMDAPTLAGMLLASVPMIGPAPMERAPEP